MNSLHLKTHSEVKTVFNNYPAAVRAKIENLRRLILKAAQEIDGLSALEETLNWGEPSYLAKHGSTVRIDWKAKTPGQYAIYFKCTSKLLPTFKKVYGDLFTFEGDRAIVFQMDDAVPEAELKQCISAALSYHKVKTLPLLGM